MYITYRVSNNQPFAQNEQTNFSDLFDNFDDHMTSNNSRIEFNPTKFFNTCTKVLDDEEYNAIKNHLSNKYRLDLMNAGLTRTHNQTQHLADQDLSNLYSTFKIPKRTGGFRTIEAPNEELKHNQRQILYLFQNTFKMLPHNNAFAYTEGRSAKEALEAHQRNKSKWFLKIDIKDFFPSITFHEIDRSLNDLFPIKPLLTYTGNGQQKIRDCIKVCLKDNKLPQGTPVSPMLSNLVMLKYDYYLTNLLKWFDNQHYVYTRYADDIIISSKYHFDWRQIQIQVENAFRGSNFKIKTEKTRYGSSAGRNWNLGLMLNKDNNITIGWRKKERFKAAIYNFFKAYVDGTEYSTEDTYHLQGLVSYYSKINKEMVDKIIKTNERKFNHRYKTILKSRLNGFEVTQVNE